MSIDIETRGSMWSSSEMQIFGHYSKIAVGMLGTRTRIRVNALLGTIPGYKVRYVEYDDEIADAVAEAQLILATELMAREGILSCKPVIIVGDYGLGGLVTPQTLHNLYNNRFKGRINGMRDEYFPLQRLEEEIKRSVDLTSQELQMMSNQLNKLLHIDF